MDPARWERVQELFHASADLPEPARSTFLNDTCGDDRDLLSDVRRMLEADAGQTPLDADVIQVGGAMFSGTLPAGELGRYRIQRLLGEGGMGVVYLAERQDLGNLVAIKILRDAWVSPARRKRFAAEQRMLAQLNHSGIARLYDADTLPDGTPWFVMEYVEGLPLVEYCQKNNCPLEERLKLVRAVAEAVEYAHEHSIIHRDIKPSNILVKPDGAVRLLDFGIAKQLDAEGRSQDPTRTIWRAMTPAYASPEQLRGAPPSRGTDIYSLGVILYELIAGRLPADVSNKTANEIAEWIAANDPVKPSKFAPQGLAAASREDLDTICLRAMDKDPERRYPSAQALIQDIDRYLLGEPIDARPLSVRHQISRFTGRNWKAITVTAVMFLAAAVAVKLAASKRSQNSPRPALTVAVLPLQNSGNDASLDFLRFALANEISTTLGYAPSLSIRSAEETEKYVAPDLDFQKVAHELGVENVVSGFFLRNGNQLQIALQVTAGTSGAVLWREVFEVPAQDTVAIQAEIAAKTRRILAPMLGVWEFVTERPPKPKNQRAYNLYLRAKAAAIESSTGAMPPERDREYVEMLQESLALDPDYTPALQALADRYAVRGWFGAGGQEALDHWRKLTDRIAALDPDNVVSRAGALYIGTAGGLGNRGEAYRQMEELLRRRPDSARLHFVASWMLRDTGLLDEAARECEISVLIDAHDAGARSCGVAFMLLSDYRRAFDFLKLDPASAVSHAVSIDVLLREGKENEALETLSGGVPQWGGYAMLNAYLRHRPSAEVAALAGDVKPGADPEVNYFSAAHLAYCGQTSAAAALLAKAIEGGYCAFPASDSDPMLASLRARPEYRQIRAAGVACRNQFLTQRATPASH